MCIKNSGMILTNHEHTKVMHASLPCHCHDCPECGPRIRRKWLQHMESIFKPHNAIYVTQISGLWDSFRSWLFRHATNWIRIENTLFSDKPSPGATRLTTKNALSRARSMIGAIHKPDGVKYFRPITSSDSWRCQNYREPSKYKRLAHASKQLFKNVLEAICAPKPVDVTSNGTTFSIVNTTAAMIGKLAVRLACCGKSIPDLSAYNSLGGIDTSTATESAPSFFVRHVPAWVPTG